MYVCICQSVTDREIRQAVDRGARTILDLQSELGVATGCGRCESCARDVMNEQLWTGTPAAGDLTPVMACG
ncbi:(2Fe-2S)-binding protein [Thioalkalicoccus limnaeus]|uniref:Bacterioferritin-associated ferredoxin n=1 Tax=Thioalkalicoccus limnaeus TaxID=120681 RepID=A0ABV4BGX1_9GAMM